jgi:hypothetical protein
VSVHEADVKRLIEREKKLSAVFIISHNQLESTKASTSATATVQDSVQQLPPLDVGT